MSGGRLVVLDRAGRDVKQFPLAEGLATLGRDPACDIRIMLPTVSPHHATVVVHANQTVIRNVCEDETLVNGSCVSVAALRHGDVIGIGGRRLRWEYEQPAARRPPAPPAPPAPALVAARRAGRAGRGRGRAGRRSEPAGAGAGARGAALQLAIEMSHRASMPGSAGGKQVAIVQPQRRDTSDQFDTDPPRTPLQAPHKRPRTSKIDLDTSVNDAENEKAKRKSSTRVSPKNSLPNLQNTTKATLWIESRKTSPRKSNKTQTPAQQQVLRVRRMTASAKKSTPLRLTVLKRAQSAHKMKVTKIEGPLKMDHTKQAALRLMTGQRAPPRPARRPAPRRRSETNLEISDSDEPHSSLQNNNISRRSGQKHPKKSASGSPRKSALKDPSAKRGSKKTESIKFDLSNLENHSLDTEVLTDASKQSQASAEDMTLRYSASPAPHRPELEAYSVVDLVSDDSVYGSAGSTVFGTPQHSGGRKTRSTIDPTLLYSSTPYVKGRSSTPRSRSDPSPNAWSKSSMNGTQSTIRSSRSRRTKSLSTPENTEDAKKHISVNSTRISRASRSRSRLNDSDLLLLDDDDDSPRTSKRISTSSKSTKFSSQTADDDTEVTPTHSPAHDEGTCTPENRHSPEEASTPVLSIQSLLDSSQSSLASQKKTKKGPSFNTKRKTIGGVTGLKTRVSAKSKSMSYSARKTRLRLSSESVELLNKNDDGEVVTPKSAVKLLQEGVKNKHSTAKKPQSKRSIIDDLNESDIVKQLFNSPVKRKLSQSMTEFSRKQLFDDDDIMQAKRPRRNITALTGQTPDNSLLDHAESLTPEIFVSPISTPTRSPSLEGIKLMFAKTTPENDLRNVRGVKGLLRTPRTRRSIKNDLTNVSGVKNIFAKSPTNRLSDVRVKEVFASSPNNDLRRVTGVKSLFQPTDKRKSPRNELDDVRGVKKLFKTKSPANDLRNVSGVKRTLRKNSPKNDLSDVRGVKRMFTREKRNELNDVSGVEELFNLSNYSSATVSTRAESLFDQLVGKPQIRAVYSKTFSNKTSKKGKSTKTKSLHESLDHMTGTDSWLEQELNKRLQIKNYLDSLKTANDSKANRSNANKSKSLHASLDEVTDLDVLLEQDLNKEQQINDYLESMRLANDSKVNISKANRSRSNRSKANMSRELQKLMTETVEGDAPIRTSRARNSTILRSDHERKKSASELYSAHTLPIKKRSLADVSGGVLSGGVVSGGAVSGGAVSGGAVSGGAVSGRGSAAASGSALPLKKRALLHSTPVRGRADLTLDATALARMSPIASTHPYAFARSTELSKTTEMRQKSTRGTKTYTDKLESDVPEFVKPSPKKTRGRAKVITPKAKPASPTKEKAVAKAKKATPVKDTAARPIKNASSAKAKNSRSAKAKKSSPAKVKKTSPVKVKKVSPTKTKASTPIKKANLKKLASPVTVKTTRSRRKDVTILESNTKKRMATLVIAKKSPVLSPKPRASRKRKEPDTSSTPKHSPKKTRASRKNDSVKHDKPKTPKNTRAKVQKMTVVVSKPSPQLKPRTIRTRGLVDRSQQDTTRSTRKMVIVQDELILSPEKSRVQTQSSSKTRAALQSAPKARGRKTDANKAKDKTEEEKPKKGGKSEMPSSKKPKSTKQEKSIEEPKMVRTRGKKIEPQVSVESASSTRGRRGDGHKLDSIAPEVRTRKRKTTAPDDEIPSKVRKSKEVADRGRKRATEVNTETTSRRKKTVVKENKVEKMPSEVPRKTTRGKKVAVEEPGKMIKEAYQKPVRGRKADIENVPVSKTGKRKRATAAEPSPAEGRTASRSRRR